ncbi:MAG: hypothetical protein E6R08_03830 [Nevskiaceae bacterium]|nr:MAG: hypothetical protein E6R08_03830 [Nevskiaceae bacterium]
MAQQRRRHFLPLGSRPFLARQESPYDGVLRFAPARGGCVADRLRPVHRHRGRGGRGLETQQEK